MKLYKRMVCILTFGIVWIGLITFSTAFPSAQVTATETKNDNPVNVSDLESDTAPAGTAIAEADSTEKLPAADTPGDISSDTSTDTDTSESALPSATPMPEPNPLLPENNSKIHMLVQRYLDAKLTCDMDEFKKIVTDTSYMDFEDIQTRTSTIKSYGNLVCYEKRGTGDIDYIVYYTYSMEIVGIETPAVAIDSLFIHIDDSGEPKIYFGEVDSETAAFLNAAGKEEDVQKLINTTFEQMAKAAASDDDLYEFWLKIATKTDG